QMCVVCSDIANGVHFGAITCEGCKKFFRRGLQEHSTYSCKSSRDCVINPRTRNSCRFCRYQKCLSAGMSREGKRDVRSRLALSCVSLQRFKWGGQPRSSPPWGMPGMCKHALGRPMLIP
ncbi:hypothetical protein CAPTEDRAFT_119978, partial [Capitella teleta]